MNINQVLLKVEPSALATNKPFVFALKLKDDIILIVF